MKFFNTRSLQNTYARFYEPENQHRLANVYWPVLISTVAILVAVSAGYGVLQFFVSPQVVATGAPTKNTPASFNKEELRRIVNVLEKRKEVFETLLAP